MNSNELREQIQGFLYSQEPWRLLTIDDRRAIISGHHRNHVLVFVDGEWNCACAAWWTHFIGRGTGWCRHTVALTRILDSMRKGKALIHQVETIH